MDFTLNDILGDCSRSNFGDTMAPYLCSRRPLKLTNFFS